MNAEKANIQTGVDAAGIPEYVFESLARSLLPVIQKYYESEGGKKAGAVKIYAQNCLQAPAE